MKKALFSIMLVAVLVSGFASMAASSEEIELHMWSYFVEGITADALREAVERYSEEHPTVNIVYRAMPFADLKREFVRAIAVEETPDIVLIDNPDHASFAAMGGFRDLTDKVAVWEHKDDFFSGPWNSTIWEGRNYGAPMGSNTIALYYNADLFRDAGLDPDNPPQTWNELREAAQVLATDDLYAISLSAIRTEEGTFQWLPFLWQNGGDIDDLAAPEAVEALELWVEFVEEGYMSREVINFTQGDAYSQWRAGTSAMAIDGSWRVEFLRGDPVDFEWRIALLPYSKEPASALGGENWAISSQDYLEESWEFIKWVQKPENKEPINIAGRLPARSDIAAASDYWAEDPVYEIFLEQMKYARARGPHPNWPEISHEIQLAIQRALTGDMSAQEALEIAAANVAELL